MELVKKYITVECIFLVKLEQCAIDSIIKYHCFHLLLLLMNTVCSVVFRTYKRNDRRVYVNHLCESKNKFSKKSYIANSFLKTIGKCHTPILMINVTVKMTNTFLISVIHCDNRRVLKFTQYTRKLRQSLRTIHDEHCNMPFNLFVCTPSCC